VRTVVDDPEPIVYVMVAASIKVEVFSDLPAAVADGWLGEPVLRGTETAALTSDGFVAAVAAAVEIKEDKLAGIGTAGDEYGDRDIVAGQIVVYAGTVTVVRMVCVASAAGQLVTVGAQLVILISCVV